MLRIACNPSLKGLSVFCPGIVYSTQTGKDITLDPVSYTHLDVYKRQMVTLVPYSSFTLAITSLVKIIIGVSALILLLAWFLSKPVAYTITKRIDSLCGYMQQTKDGILKEVPDIIYKDEIGTLYAVSYTHLS